MGNPDGIQFTHKIRSRPPINPREWARNDTARPVTRPAEWHKNVESEGKDEVCFGTNINRNFAYHWQGQLQFIAYTYSDNLNTISRDLWNIRTFILTSLIKFITFAIA